MSQELCILGLEKSKSNIRLLEEAKRLFDSVFFVPINGIGIGLSEKFSITYRTTDLFKFPAVLARIPRDFWSYGYQLLSLFPTNTFMPIKPISFLLADERFFMLTVLRKKGVDTVNMKLARSKKAAERILEGNSYPFIIRTPEKKTGVYVKNPSEAKSIVDTLASLDKPILMEAPTKDMVSVYVTKPDVIASVKKKSKEKDIVFGPGTLKNTKISIEIEHLALEAAAAVEAQFARIDISTDDFPRVVNIDLNPGLISSSKVTGVDIPEKIITSLKGNFEDHLKKPLLVKFFEDASSVVQDVLKSKQFL